MRRLRVAAAQMAMSADRAQNLAKAERLVRDAARAGAQVIVLPELFASLYFPKDESAAHFGLAEDAHASEVVARMSALAAELAVVLPVSFFERASNVFFNSLAMIDADGAVRGIYRKSHIPDGPGYEEKFYFSPGDTGFRVFATRYAKLGAAVCWDQWFPECARALALMGAELLLYPTAIGSEPPPALPIESAAQWRRVMQGHAAANLVPVIAANRYGKEQGQSCAIDFYGGSFITDHTGEIVAEAPRAGEAVITATFDLDEIAARRAAWGVFRDRRPDLYGALLTLGGDA
jgi:N-carbamoylputrescine amidase